MSPSVFGMFVGFSMVGLLNIGSILIMLTVSVMIEALSILCFMDKCFSCVAQLLICFGNLCSSN